MSPIPISSNPNEECIEGKRHAYNLMDSLNAVNAANAKAQILPLQGPIHYGMNRLKRKAALLYTRG